MTRKILFNGWPLIYAPNSPAALHLLTLLEYFSKEIEAIVALPAEAPEWLPKKVKAYVHPMSGKGSSQLRWEQLVLDPFRDVGGGLFLVQELLDVLLGVLRVHARHRNEDPDEQGREAMRHFRTRMMVG